MRIAICDDQQSSLEHVVAKVRSLGLSCEISSFLDISVLTQQIRDGINFDTILMDIEWEGEQRGIDFAAVLYTLSPKAKIIFITGYPENYSQQIFLKNTNLRGFVAKPIDTEILSKNLKKIKDEMVAQESRKLLLKFNGAVVGIDPDDILFIESRGHKATVCSVDGEYICYEKLDALAGRLPGHFILTHKSFLVNMDKVRRIDRESVMLIKNIEIPLSKSRQGEVRESYFRYVGSNI